jgi:hypothetical protein
MATDVSPRIEETTALPFALDLPRGVDPLTYGLDVVNRAIAPSFFSLFSVPNPATPDVPLEAKLPFPFSLLQRLPFFPQLLAGVSVNEAPLRFVVEMQDEACQLLALNAVGQSIATVHIDWTPIPWDYNANPYTKPPQTILNPLVSQRFEMLNGEFRFDDTASSGFHGFGSGRTFPNFPLGLSLKIGAVIDILEGFGAMQGFKGTVVVNGQITPPNELDLNLMVRVLDPEGKFRTHSPLPPLVPKPFPDPAATFMLLLGEPDPASPSTLRRGPDGAIVGLELHERLRMVGLDADVVPGQGLKSRLQIGAVVGRAKSTLHFPLTTSTVPIPAQTTDGEFTFFNSRSEGSRSLGTVRANLVEGRGFPTPVAGAPAPVYRVGGFGPVLGGTGEFAGCSGMLSMNAVLGIFPRTLSNMYIFRFVDPDGRLRPYPTGPQS